MDVSLKRRLLLIAILFATLMTSIETTIITTALTTIVSQLNGLRYQSWVFAVYLLTMSVSTPLFGNLADQVGRKPIFISGILLFCFGSLGSGLSINMLELIGARAVQGIGAGAIIPLTFTLIADLYDFDERPKAIALNNTVWGISALLGPLLGGYIVEYLSWHWLFFINLPFGILVFIIILTTYKEKRPVKSSLNVDVVGLVSLSTVLVTLLLFLQLISINSINLSLLLILVVGFLMGLWQFFRNEKRNPEAIIPVDLFKNRVFVTQITTALLLSTVQIAFQTYFPMLLQVVYGVSPATAGLVVTPSPIFWLLASLSVGYLLRHYAPKSIAVALIVILFISYLPIVFIGSTTPIFVFYIVSAITGSILGIVITMNILVAQKVSKGSELGSATSMIALGRSLGQTFATGVFGMVFNLTVQMQVIPAANHQLKNFMMNQLVSHRLPNGFLKNEMDHLFILCMEHIFLLVLLFLLMALIINFKSRVYSINQSQKI